MLVSELKKGYYKLRFDSLASSDIKCVEVVKIDKNIEDSFTRRKGSTAIKNHSTKNKLLIWLWHDTVVHDVTTATKKDMPR